MAHDWPHLREIVTTAREFIESVTPGLSGLDRYHGMCASYLLEIAERELAHWQAPDDVDDGRLRRLAAAGPEVPREELTRRVCERIRAGGFDACEDELRAELLAHVIAKVRVSKPGHLEPEHRA